ncbi:MAG: hypothetical protein ACKVON_11850 [Beijerinckiaceae bacterium]
MTRYLGLIYAAVAALVIATAPVSTAQAAPLFVGPGTLIRETLPALTETVQFRGRGYRGGGFRHRGGYGRGGYARRGIYRRGFYGRPAFYGAPVYYGRPAYYGPRCFIRPARTVLTPYGYEFRPARRICRY